MDTKELQRRQAEYDQQYWQHNASKVEKIRHITLHLGKLLGKVSSYCEAEEHGQQYPTTQIEEEVIPDLLFYTLQLSNLLGKDLAEQYIQRLEKNIQKNTSH
jgi:NTP pyrophosphatase (non-canonical NTP hydrolase)